jgi:hypothetical protein
MPTVTVLPSGINAGFSGPGGTVTHTASHGWSRKSAQRNMRFLMGVSPDTLPDPLYATAYTLTVPHAPPSHEEWSLLIDRLRKRMAREGVMLDHWVTEWTRRGVPHLHGILVFDVAEDQIWYRNLVHVHWVRLTRAMGIQTAWHAQHCQPIHDLRGWMQYIAKHAGRGYAHYQRQRDSLPEGWQRTGSMWGKSRGWPMDEEKTELTDGEFYVFRRLCQRYLVSESKMLFLRSRKEFLRRSYLRQFVYRRSMFKTPDFNRSRCRGLSEWVPKEVALRLLCAARAIAPPETHRARPRSAAKVANTETPRIGGVGALAAGAMGSGPRYND